MQKAHEASGNTLPDAYQQSAAHKDQFFARKMNENASRAEGVPPSQGGKFVGFGSTPPPPARGQNDGVADLTAMLSSGWSRFTSVATAAATQAGTAAQSTARTLDEQYRTGQLAHTAQDSAQQAWSTAQQLSQQGWGMLSSAVRGTGARAGAAAAPSSAGTNDSWGGHDAFDTPASVAAQAPHMSRGDGSASEGWGAPSRSAGAAAPDYLSGAPEEQQQEIHSGARAGSGSVSQRRRGDAKGSDDWDSGW